ncbi:MAG: hypothetical protein KDE09_09055 [Anaerolineales bacterium]|nr:hypothetical protein [Anaerolineales bacterium]MCB0007335.1 hypothetical protein [Anaerolineales bacterium]MCB0012235.1 hypothetical protein [Anaerolineales bacterium]MCB0017924.1 hypothetical protein [Anaerolineales bacterium]MCB0029953.1 hypothetical protein [Anaerolineales bacterium]
MNASNRFLVKRWTAIGLLAAILLLLPNFASAAPVTINFGTDGAGNPVIAGQVLDDEWNTPAYGNMVISSPTNATHPIVAFNSSIPTGGDPDLGSPNQTCPGGGPGVGVGGVVGAPFENCTSLGMLVIIEENCPLSTAVGGIITYPSCGAPGPDDNGGANGPAGGIINFTFGTTVDDQVTIESFELLDFEDPAGAGGVTVNAYAFDGTLVATFAAPAIGDNGSAIVDVTFAGSNLPWAGVSRVEFVLEGSGSVGTLSYETPAPTAIGLDAISIRSDATYYGIVAFLTLAALSLTSVAYLRRERLVEVRS